MAAVNGPAAVVVSGEAAALDELMAQCEALQIRARRIDVDYASHSAHVAPDRGPTHRRTGRHHTSVVDNRVHLHRDRRTTRYRRAGRSATGTAMCGKTVSFDQAVRSASEHRCRTFIEASPHPALIAAVEDTVRDCTDGDIDPIVVPSLGRDDGGIDRFLASAAQAFVAGAAPDWRETCRGGLVELPTYAFDRRRFWLSGGGSGISDVAGLGLAGAEHALLGAVVEIPDSGQVVLTGRLSPSSQPWLTDHAVAGTDALPRRGLRGTGDPRRRRGRVPGCRRIDAARAAAAHTVGCPGAGGGRRQQTSRVRIGCRCSRGRARTARPGCCTPRRAVSATPSEPTADLSVWPPVGAVPVDVTEAYDVLAARGYEYGPAFRGLTAMWRRGEELFAEVAAPEARRDGRLRSASGACLTRRCMHW